EALDVDHPLQGNRVAAVLRLEGQRRLPAAGAQLGGAECLLQRVGARRRDERAHDLAAVEGDLDTNPLLRHATPPPTGPRSPSRGEGARTPWFSTVARCSTSAPKSLA